MIDEGKPQGGGAVFESAQVARALAGVVGVRTGVFVDERARQHAIDHDGQLAGGGGEGFGLADADGQAAVEGPEGGIGRDAIDLGEVDAGQLVEGGADVDGGFVAVAASDAGTRKRCRGRLNGGGQGLEFRGDGFVAGAELTLTHVVEFEILLQDKEMFGLVVAGEGSDDLGLGGLAVRVTVGGEDLWVLLAGDEGAENRQAGLADDIADDARELEVHLDERLLHPPDVGPRGLHQDLAVAQVGAQRQDLPGGPEAPAQQADRVELAQPLTVLDVALAAGDVLDVAGVDEQDLEAVSLETRAELDEGLEILERVLANAPRKP